MRSLQVVLLAVLLPAGIACQLKAIIGEERQASGAGPATADTDQGVPAKLVLKLPLQDPHIVILKSSRQLDLYSAGAVVRTYRVGLGLSPVADKKQEGDGATPEGGFYIFTKNPKSAYYLSLGISYPNIEDAERGLRDGLISRVERDAIIKAIKEEKGASPKYGAGRRNLYSRAWG